MMNEELVLVVEVLIDAVELLQAVDEYLPTMVRETFKERLQDLSDRLYGAVAYLLTVCPNEDMQLRWKQVAA